MISVDTDATVRNPGKNESKKPAGQDRTSSVQVGSWSAIASYPDESKALKHTQEVKNK
jgi:hypothetical protein